MPERDFNPCGDVTLVKPSARYTSQIRAYREEFADCLDWLHGAAGLAQREDPEEWLRYVALCENPQTVPDGVPVSSQFLYVRHSDEKIVGMIHVRHYPLEPLCTFGGHVGYSICPSERRKGYATSMLRDVLPHCKAIGLSRVLLTAGDENVGSVKAILANGGVYEGSVLSPKHHIMVRRYWIELDGRTPDNATNA